MSDKADKVPVNSHGTNVAIKAHILPDDEMHTIGFTDRDSSKWYYYRMVPGLGKGIEISFNVTIPKDCSDIEIITLDEDFLQPYNYESILERNPNLECALKVRDFVEEQMKYLQDTGVLSGHHRGNYI